MSSFQSYCLFTWHNKVHFPSGNLITSPLEVIQMFKHLTMLRNLRNSNCSWIPAPIYLYRKKRKKNNPPDSSVKARQKNDSCIRHPVCYCYILVDTNFTLSVIQWLELKYCKSRSSLETAQAIFCTVS